MLHSVYAAYVAQCRQANAMDFDDLLYYFNILLRDHPEVQAECAASVDYLLIDEYQDTNPSQYLIARRLVEAKQRIFAVGDDEVVALYILVQYVRLPFPREQVDRVIARLPRNVKRI